MELECSAFDQNRFERLDAQTVQGRRTVEHDGMVFDNDFQRVPDLGFRAVNSLTSRLDVGGSAGLDQPLHDKRLKQLERHLLRNAALIHLQVRSNDDNASAGIVNALTKKVLSESTLFTFEHIRKGFERTVVGAGDGASAAAVVDQCIDRFLKHTLLVADDDIGSLKLKQPF